MAPTDQVFKYAVQACMPKLLSHTSNIWDVVIHLYSRRILDDSTVERLRLPTMTQSEKLEEVLFILLKKDFAEFKIFQEVLLETNNTHSHDFLEQRLDQELAQITSILTFNTATELPINDNPQASSQLPGTQNGAASSQLKSNESANSTFEQSIVNISTKQFEGLSDFVQRNLLILELDCPAEMVACELIQASLENARLLKKVSFTGVKFSGKFSRSTMLQKLESVSFTNCEIQSDITWKQMMFFTKKKSDFSMENIWKMGVQIYITCDNVALLQVNKQTGTLIINCNTGIDLKVILQDIVDSGNQAQLRVLEATGFRPSAILLPEYPNLQKLHLLEVAIKVFKDMGMLREILQRIGSICSLQCSIGTNHYSRAEKSVVVFMSKIKSAGTLETLKMANLDLKLSDKNIEIS